MRRLAVAALLAGAACGGSPAPEPQPSRSTQTPPPGGVVVSFGERSVSAEVADTVNEWPVGLMHRESLGADSGMLFVFDRPHSAGFWMKNTLIPLSIAFLVDDPDIQGAWRVVDILDMEPCTADPCPLHNPGVPYDAALEVNKGWFAASGVRRGDLAVLEGQLPDPSAPTDPAFLRGVQP